ncbi:E3 ubiquitin-protein ligase MARCHF2-like isoform X2 [Rhipicephalus sanguineus]|nr:E3 ubiquitin-protein ligase MARCHF2-like isoform X2 [Rhipicephalus sanguineus]
MYELAAFINSSREDEDTLETWFKDDRTSSSRSPEAVCDSEDEPKRENVCVDLANGNHSGTDSSGAMCRICHEGDQKAELVSPCSCSGTIGFVHVSCIEHWLNERNVDVCELCGQRFQMAAQTVTTLRFFRWVWRNKRWLWRSLVFELLGLVLVTPVAACVFYVLAILTLQEDGAAWYVVLLDFLSIVAFIFYVVRTLNKLRTRYRMYLA